VLQRVVEVRCLIGEALVTMTARANDAGMGLDESEWVVIPASHLHHRCYHTPFLLANNLVLLRVRCTTEAATTRMNGNTETDHTKCDGPHPTCHIMFWQKQSKIGKSTRGGETDCLVRIPLQLNVSSLTLMEEVSELVLKIRRILRGQ
jgi:hypothetical protein